MPSWLIKAGVQGVISLLPRSQDLNYFFQRYVSKGLVLKDWYFEDKVKTARQHLENYNQFRQSSLPLPSNALELGTGWLPIVPIALSLCGIKQIYSVDISPLTKAHLIKEVIDHFIKYTEDGRIYDLLPVENVDIPLLRRVQETLQSASIEEALQLLNITSIVADARQLTFEAGEIEFFVSNSTFEHIPPDILQGIMQEFHRVATDDALSSHLIDLSDHYSHFDKNLTAYNFLKFEDNIWRLANNALQYQNRLRISDYRSIHNEAGFDIVSETNKDASNPIDPEALAEQFKKYSHDDLIITSSFMVSRI